MSDLQEIEHGGGASRSSLTPEPQSLAMPALFAVMMHIFLGSTLACVSWVLGPSEPAIREVEVMQVSMMVLPKSKSRMPERAQAAPRPTSSVPAPVPDAPKPVGAATPTPAPPPPIRQSDLAVKSPDVKPTKGETQAPSKPSRDADREAAMRRLLMDEALDAPEGATDRNATDPNSTSDEAINATGLGLKTDPEYARYISKIEALLKKNFNPLPTIVAANPGISATVRFQVDPATGRITEYEIKKSSGNASYDRAVETSVQAVPTVPLPPERFRPLLAGGYTFVFEPT